jgi:glycosyltransferase involved in cell wall biosynthesis
LRTILHLIPTLEGGGAERQLALLAREQSAQGYRVHIGLRRRGVFGSDADLPGVRVHELGDHRWIHPHLIRSMRRLIDRLSPHLVQTWLGQADVCGGLAASAAGVPWVMTERASAGAYPANSMLAVFRRRVARRANAIVANSQSGAHYWRTLSRWVADISVVRNAVEAAAVRAVADAGRATGTTSSPFVLCVGRLAPSKRHQLALRAWERAGFEGGRLLLLGDGPCRERLAAAIGRSSARSRVELQPFAPDWWKHLGQADALLSLGCGEGAPNVVLEAMATGVPLLLSDTPPHRELADSSCAVFAPLDEADAVAGALRGIIDDRDAARARALRATQRLEQHRPEATVAAYEAVYARHC